MKRFAKLKVALISTGLILAGLIFLQSSAFSQKVIRPGADDQHLRVELMEYSYFERMYIVSELHKLQNAKVAISEEEGVVYVYPLGSGLDEVLNAVTGVTGRACDLEERLDKDSESAILNSIKAEHGDWVEYYALTGQRDTQNDSCHKSMPFCTGTIYTFPAGTNTQAQSGPAYNCLSTRPNPAWYHLKIEDPGPIGIYMYSTPSRDIDFCLWGPFTDPITPCPMTNTNGGLTNSKVVDCSYSPNPTETANIPNGQPGQYYILIITNYSNQPCNVTFQQTSGTGTTDCTILPPPATSNSPVCVGGTLQLSAANVPQAAYQWTGPAGFISNVQNPSINGITHSNAGVYTLTITYNGITSEPTNTEVFVYDPPTATISGTTSICEGDSALLTINATSVGPFRVTMSNGIGGLPSVINFWQTTHSFWVYPTQTTTYTLTSVQNNACSGTTSGQAVITVRQRPVTDFSSANQCTQQVTNFTDLTPVPLGGIASWAWNFGDGNTSNLQNPTHTFTTGGIYNVGLTVTANNGCEKTATKPVSIYPTPVVSAGPDKTIAYGTNTTLNGSASGGSGTHTYQWQPADKVDNPVVLAPTTVLLAATTDFTLTATDSGNGCISTDQMTVTITGGPLAAFIESDKPEICLGGSTYLNAVISGGSGSYTYTWTSTPAGFNSQEQDITVSPSATTTYNLSIYDGFNTINTSYQVVVNPLPNPNAGDDQSIPHGTSTMLTSQVTGGTSPYTYQWSPADLLVAPTMYVTPTHNLYASQNFTMEVTDSKGCKSTGQTVVTITGGPLQVNPVAVKPIICRNESTEIRAIPGGGSNTYQTYSWTSNPPGFTSTQANPVVNPVVTTVYTVEVFDGYNYATGNVTVSVNQLPEIYLAPVNDPRVMVMSPVEIGLCVYDTITLDAGNPGSTYLWSNGSTNQTIDIKTSGISFDIQEYQVMVHNPLTGCSNEGNITAYFTFQYCSYGMEENAADRRLQVYPNPSVNGEFNLLIDGLKGDASVQVYSSEGRLISDETLKLMQGSVHNSLLNLRSKASGVYYLKLVNPEAVILRKLIIQ